MKKWINRFKNDHEWRLIVTSTISSIITGCIMLYYWVLSILDGSMWLATLAGYYGMLILARAGVLILHRIARRKEAPLQQIQKWDAWIHFASGILMMLMSFGFAALVVISVIFNYHSEYAGQLIYISAVYAVYKVVSASVNAVRARKNKDLVAQSIRNINVSDSVVSIVSLHATMLMVLGAGKINTSIPNSIMSSFGAVVLFALSISMMVRGYKAYARLKVNSNEV